jgi:hypothetical protein
MKNRKGILFVFIPLVITISLYVVFFERIASKPGDAGFWFIFALGASVGVVITRFFEWSNTKKSE